LKALLQQCRERNVRLKIGKRKFYQKEVGYMGRIITDRGIEPDPAKVLAINNYPSPKNIKDLVARNGQFF